MDESIQARLEQPKLPDAQIEALLRTEIAWTIFNGPGWDPTLGATFDDGWTADDCAGTCAIGALLVHRQPAWHTQVTTSYDDIATASLLLRRSYRWVAALYFAVAVHPDERDGHQDFPDQWDAVCMGFRLRDYGDALAAAQRK